MSNNLITVTAYNWWCNRFYSATCIIITFTFTQMSNLTQIQCLHLIILLTVPFACIKYWEEIKVEAKEQNSSWTAVLHVQCTPLNKAMFKKATLVYGIQSHWNRFFLYLFVHKIFIFIKTLPVLAFVYTIDSSATFTAKVADLAGLV